MATLGLKGIWGLEQLDRTGIATWKLGVLLMGGGVLFGATLIPILGEVNPDSFLASFYTPKVVALLFVFLSFATGFNVFVGLVFARNIEADLHFLSSIDSSVNESIKRLQLRNIPLPYMVLFAVIVVQVIFLTAEVVTMNITITERFTALHSSGLVLNLLMYLLLSINGLTAGILLSIFVTQSLSLMRAARQMKVDLLQLNHYSAMANPAVRLILLLLVVFSFFPLMTLFIDDSAFTSAASLAGLALFLMYIPILLLYAYPLVVLRGRIRDEKQNELDVVIRCLQGDSEAVKAINIQGLGVPATTADLLTHQMFVESRWEWPITSHVQKLILFGLLPPVAWVLAATIEYGLYG